MIDTIEKGDIKELTKSAKYLADNDVQGFLLVKASIDVLTARCDMEKQIEEKEIS